MIEYDLQLFGGGGRALERWEVKKTYAYKLLHPSKNRVATAASTNFFNDTLQALAIAAKARNEKTISVQKLAKAWRDTNNGKELSARNITDIQHLLNQDNKAIANQRRGRSISKARFDAYKSNNKIIQNTLHEIASVYKPASKPTSKSTKGKKK